MMIKREMYMKRIRPFIETDLIKVMTGIRRCGKSVMLELIKEELIESGVNPAQFISINFEDLNYAHLQTAKALHDEITGRAADIPGKVYLFFDEIQEVKDWEKCINSLRVNLDCDIYNRLKRQAPVQRAFYLSRRTLCKVHHLPILLRGISRTVPSHRT